MSDAIITTVDERGVATLTLNRADKHNAFDDVLISRLTDTLNEIGADDSVRVLVLGATGKSFSAGADLDWMRRTATYTREENLKDATALAALLRALANLSQPSVARIQGAAYGGGVGLIACCDIAVASERARFCLSEVKLGLIPGAISPYVCAAIGPRAARRYILTAETFDARQAQALGLVHEVVAADALAPTVEKFVHGLLNNGPRAMRAAKRLAEAVAGRPIDEAVIAETAVRIAEQRASAEGREGVSAFLEKRPPAWIKPPQAK